MGGVRFHGMFGDDMEPVVTAPGVYNFTQIDSTWDFLHGNQIQPVVALSFMPTVLANCSWHGHFVQNPVGCHGYSCWRGDCKIVGETPGRSRPSSNPSAPARRAKEFHYQGIKHAGSAKRMVRARARDGRPRRLSLWLIDTRIDYNTVLKSILVSISHSVYSSRFPCLLAIMWKIF
jgi:hypothetical protein